MYALDRFVITGYNGNNIIVKHEIGRTNLMSLRSCYYRRAIELAKITEIVKVASCFSTLNGRLEITKSFLCADNSSSLAAGSSFYVSNYTEERFLVVITSRRKINCTAEICSGRRIPKRINVVKELLAERFADFRNKLVKIYLTGKNSVKFLIYLYNLERCGYRSLGLSTKSLTANTLSTFCCIRNNKQIAVLYYKFVLVAKGNISKIYKSVKIFILICLVKYLSLFLIFYSF